MERTIDRFAEHYKKVDRRYGQYPIYSFNGTLFAFGKEMDILAERFDEWNDPNMRLKLDNFRRKTPEGNECLVFHIGWLDTLSKIIPLRVINSEEVSYKMYRTK